MGEPIRARVREADGAARFGDFDRVEQEVQRNLTNGSGPDQKRKGPENHRMGQRGSSQRHTGFPMLRQGWLNPPGAACQIRFVQIFDRFEMQTQR